MNREAEVISAICKNKDIAPALTGNLDGIFQSHADIWKGLK